MAGSLLVLSPYEDHMAHIPRGAPHFCSVSLCLWDQTSIWNVWLLWLQHMPNLNIDSILINISLL